MQRVLVMGVLGGATLFQLSMTVAWPQQALNAEPTASLAASPVNGLVLPPLPRGKSTVIGGAIQNVDPVRDQITLKVYGEKPVKILFDERTKVFRDGSRIPVHDLGQCEHASVQTMLDGTDVFAVSVHILSESPQGDFRGRVQSYNPGTGEMSIDSGSAGGHFKLLVTKDTVIARQGQSSFSSAQSGVLDLKPGTLVSVKFESNQQGRGLAREVAVLAVPGSEFIFSGIISSLDMHSAFMVLLDPRDDKTYQIFFNPAQLPTTQDLHVGEHLRVVVNYDGTDYMASDITAN